MRKIVSTILHIVWKFYQKGESFFYQRKKLKNVESIVVFFKAGIGNMILFLPSLRLLRKKFNYAKIILICSPRGAEEVAKLSQVVDRVEVHPQSKIKDLFILGREINKKYKPQIVISTQPGLSGSLIGFLSGAEKRIGFRYPMGFIKNSDFLYTDPVVYHREVHEVERYLNLLKVLGIQEDEKLSIKLKLGKQEMGIADQVLKSYGLKEDDFLVGFHPGSYNDQKFKRWPVEHWRELARLLIDHYQAKIIILGDKTEKDLADGIITQSFKQNLFDLTGKTSLPQAAGIIRRCNFFVSNDSGLMHLSASVGTPIFAVFGPTNPVKNRPWAKKAWVIKLNLKCQPCYQAFQGEPKCRYKKEQCLTRLKPERVFNQIIQSYRI